MGEIKRREFMGLVAGLIGGAAFGCAGGGQIGMGGTGLRTHDSARSLPNILWIVAEDTGLEMGCYGQALVPTPHLDRLAAQGVRFTGAFSTAPVCSPSRSSFITGMDPIAIDVQHHRSHREDGYRLPAGVRLVTDCLRDAGYFTSNASVHPDGVWREGKTDFNFTAERPFDGIDWRERPAGQPFFAMVNLFESHRGFPWDEARKNPNRIDPAKVPLPAYYPDDPVVREDVATYLTVITQMDAKVGAILRRLEDEGLAENTIVFFFADHGRCLLRGKQWLYDAGLRVPLIARWPGHLPAGVVNGDLVNLTDVTATTLALAGVGRPARMDGRPLFGPGARRRTAVFAARDRCDKTRDRIRCARDARFKYIRNFMPERPYTQPNTYIEGGYPVLGVLKREYAKGTLTPAQALFMQPAKPPEELYDVTADPDEVNNLATRPEYQGDLKRLRKELDRWLKQTGDTGARPEPATAILKEDR